MGAPKIRHFAADKLIPLSVFLAPCGPWRMMNKELEKELVTPPRALIRNNPVLWLRFFGPGAIVASLTLGSGETLFASRGGTIFGYRILWVFLLVSFMKWLLAYSGMRHMILSGGHPLYRWSLIGGPRGWFTLFMFLVVLVCQPIWASFLLGLLGTVCAWIFGVGDLYLWATACAAVAVVLLALGGYDFLEKAQMIILGVTGICIVVAMFYVGADWLAAAKGAFLPKPLSYPDWLPEKLPQFRLRSVWVEVLVYVSAIGGSSYDYLAYTSFLRDKKWGRSHMGLAGRRQLEETAEQLDHPARVWLRAALIDTLVSFAALAVLSCCFAMLGTIILSPLQQVPEGNNLLNYQATFLTALSPWLLPLYQIAIFLTFFGTIYGGPELLNRVFVEYLDTLPRWRGHLPVRKIRGAAIFLWLGVGLVLLWSSRFYPDLGLVDIVTPAAIYTGVLTCGFYCLANPWMDRRFLPAALRMSSWLVVANVVAGVTFVAVGLKALWDYGQFGSFLTLAAMLIVSIILASQLKFLQRGGADSPGRT